MAKELNKRTQDKEESMRAEFSFTKEEMAYKKRQKERVARAETERQQRQQQEKERREKLNIQVLSGLSPAQLKDIRQAAAAARQIAWQAFMAKLQQGLIPDSSLVYGDIPFPPLPEISSVSVPQTATSVELSARCFLSELQDLPDDAERTKVIRAAYLNWHPDKFAQKLGSKLHPDFKEQILEQVKKTAQRIASVKDQFSNK
eukprot:gb/GEZN01019522.1/.p1 GENE.gb/GEZN01019522.1/~~gb/GEZN01019522.1/.p1  ORF type:complete len:222 (-),score=54.31 gb/GEZN01019522.1/:50-655(-)